MMVSASESAALMPKFQRFKLSSARSLAAVAFDYGREWTSDGLQLLLLFLQYLVVSERPWTPLCCQSELLPSRLLPSSRECCCVEVSANDCLRFVT